jgi:hypothetical protein
MAGISGAWQKSRTGKRFPKMLDSPIAPGE